MKKQKVMKKNNKASIIIVLAVIVSFFIFWGLSGKTRVDYYTLKTIDLNYTILANCTVDYPQPLDMTFLQDGIIQSVEVKDGDSIRKGQKLIQMDDFNERQNLVISSNNIMATELKLRNAREENLPRLKEKINEAKANLDQAKLMVERYKELESAGGISRVELENAEKDYQKALSQYNQLKLELNSFFSSGLIADLQNQISTYRAQYELAKKRLENTRILSPYDGSVLKVYVQPGEKVNTASRAVTIIEKKNWLLVLNVDQKEIPFLKPNLPATVVLDAYPDTKIKAEVVYICTEVSKEKNTCEVRVEIKENLPFIKYGMAGIAEIYAEKYEKILALPSRFIKKQSGGNYVWIWNGAKAQLTNVIFRQVGERWVIIENLSNGTKILDVGLKVNPERLVLGKEVVK